MILTYYFLCLYKYISIDKKSKTNNKQILFNPIFKY